MKLPLDHTFETDQGTVRFGCVGKGPPVVCVHGTPWSSYTWNKIMPNLAQSHRIYYYDLIGYGQSDMREGQRVSLDVQGRIFANLLGHWKLDDPTIIAHDFGGAISLRAHLLHDCAYERLLLMNVVAMAPWGSPFFAHVQEHEAAFAGVPSYIHEAIVERYIKGAIYKDLPPEELKGLVSPWLSEEGQAAFYRQIAQADQAYTDEVEPEYGNIRCPVKILWGEEDEWIPIATGQRLHSAIPQSTFHPIPKSGHLVQMDNPEDVAFHIMDFLEIQDL